MVKIKQLSQRNDYTTLPFHKSWEEARNEIYKGNHINAQRNMIELAQKLAQSPDLTEEHRFHLIQAYKANFEKEVAFYEEIEGFSKESTASVSRSAEGLLGPQESLQRTAYLANEAGMSDTVVNGLIALSDNWSSIPEIDNRSEKSKLNNQLLNDQLRALQKITKLEKADPKKLADAIALAALSPE
jgi:hypothetical protein